MGPNEGSGSVTTRRAGWTLILLVALGLAPLRADAVWGTKGYASARATFVPVEESYFVEAERIFFFRGLTTVQSMTDFQSAAVATHGANMPLGLLWARSWALHADRYGDADARSSASLRDTLLIDVPAGFYPAGVALTVTGYIGGNIDLWGDANTTAHANWEVKLDLTSSEKDKFFGSVDYAASNSVYVNDELHVVIDEPFSVTVVVYPPGYTATSDWVFPALLNFTLGLPQDVSLGEVRSVSYEGDVGGDPAPYGESSIDMLTTGAITSIDVTGDGVTWTSESGALLVPEPGFAPSLGAGVGLLAVIGRRWRIRERR